MLEINNLHVEVENKEILSGIDLKIKAGEMHAIMGLNGSGKSTLSNAITGRENYNVTKGDIIFKDESILEMDTKYLKRAVNEGFSGGEKKRNEMLQLLCLEPELAIMDETDSGLDIDALKIISKGINKYKNSSRSFLVITHYQRLLKYIEPDVVHVLIDGKIVKSGGKELALELEEKGYSWLES